MRITRLKGDNLAKWLKYVDKKINRAGSSEERQAWQSVKAFADAEGFQQKADESFKKKYIAWLLGRGTKAELERTPWGNRREMLKLRGVRNWIATFIEEKYNVLRKITHLLLMTPQNEHEAYLYYKYIVHGGAPGKPADEWFYEQLCQEDSMIFSDFDKMFIYQREVHGRVYQQRDPNDLPPAAGMDDEGFVDYDPDDLPPDFQPPPAEEDYVPRSENFQSPAENFTQPFEEDRPEVDRVIPEKRKAGFVTEDEGYKSSFEKKTRQRMKEAFKRQQQEREAQKKKKRQEATQKQKEAQAAFAEMEQTIRDFTKERPKGKKGEIGEKGKAKQKGRAETAKQKEKDEREADIYTRRQQIARQQREAKQEPKPETEPKPEAEPEPEPKPEPKVKRKKVKVEVKPKPEPGPDGGPDFEGRGRPPRPPPSAGRQRTVSPSPTRREQYKPLGKSVLGKSAQEGAQRAKQQREEQIAAVRRKLAEKLLSSGYTEEDVMDIDDTVNDAFEAGLQAGEEAASRIPPATAAKPMDVDKPPKPRSKSPTLEEMEVDSPPYTKEEEYVKKQEAERIYMDGFQKWLDKKRKNIAVTLDIEGTNWEAFDKKTGQEIPDEELAILMFEYETMRQGKAAKEEKEKIRKGNINRGSQHKGAKRKLSRKQKKAVHS